MPDLALPAAIVLLYVGVLVGAAVWGERQEARGRRVVSNRLVYSLSLAVYATTWTVYGSVGFAARNGVLFLSVYLGPTLCATLWWWILRGLVRLKERHRITSIADVLSLRYAKSHRVAVLATVVAVVGLVPYLALQLKTMIATLCVVAGGGPGLTYPAAGRRLGPPLVAVMFLLTAAFGLRRVRPTERHPGLVLALAIESVVKLAAALAAGAFVTWGLFDGPVDLFRRAALPASPAPDLLGGHGVLTWLSHLVVSAAAVLLLPRQFHVAVLECADEDHVRTASWVFPLYLLVINVFVLPVALGGLLLGHPASAADGFLLKLPLDAGRPLLSWLVFLGGFSAGAGMVVVETTALATMISNHVVIPVCERVRALVRVRRRIRLVRWAAAAALLAAAFAYERLFGDGYSLASLGFISFTAVLQLAPALAGGIVWRGASRAGAVAGLSAGLLIWFYAVVVPVMVHAGWLPASLVVDGPCGIEALQPEGLFDVHLDPVTHAVLWTLLFNGAAFVAGSLLFPPRPMELAGADELLGVLAGAPATADAAAPVLSSAPEKQARAAALLAQYHGDEDARRLARACLERIGADPAGALSALQVAELQAEVETTLAAAIGSAGAHAAVRRHPIATADEARAISAAYADILASLNVSPAELRRKIDYHREREHLLARDVSHQRVLAAVSGLLATSLDLDATGRTAVRVPVPLLADAALLWIRAADGHSSRAWFAHVDALLERAGEGAVTAHAETLGAAEPIARALDRGQPVVALADGPSWPLDLAACLPAGRQLTLPLLASRGTLGTLSLFVDDGVRLRDREEVGVAEELAHRLALALENARLYLQAESAVRVRDEFLAVASHELKTPLTPLRLKIQTLQRLVARGDLARLPPEKLAQLFGGAEGQVRRIVGLVDDLLDVTRLTTNRLRLRPEPVELGALVGDVLERHAAEAAQAGCSVQLAAGTPAIGTWDRLRLEQVCTNLLTNAFKYAPGSRVRISVDADAARARLVVHDEGPGIAPADQERIFRPFERAVRFIEVSGFGLGLYIVRQIVEAHGGTVRLESSVGRGSTFRIELPRAAPAAA